MKLNSPGSHIGIIPQCPDGPRRATTSPLRALRVLLLNAFPLPPQGSAVCLSKSHARPQRLCKQGRPAFPSEVSPAGKQNRAFPPKRTRKPTLPPQSPKEPPQFRLHLGAPESRQKRLFLRLRRNVLPHRARILAILPHYFSDLNSGLPKPRKPRRSRGIRTSRLAPRVDSLPAYCHAPQPRLWLLPHPRSYPAFVTPTAPAQQENTKHQTRTAATRPGSSANLRS